MWQQQRDVTSPAKRGRYTLRSAMQRHLPVNTTGIRPLSCGTGCALACASQSVNLLLVFLSLDEPECVSSGSDRVSVGAQLLLLVVVVVVVLVVIIVLVVEHSGGVALL